MLPEEIWVEIFTYLDYRDRVKVAIINKEWNRCFKSCSLWHDIKVQFQYPSDRKFFKLAQNFGRHIQRLHLACYQKEKENCENTCQFIALLQRTEELYISQFILEFCEQNPLFYSGDLILNSLQGFFNYNGLKNLKHIDLSKFSIAFDDSLLEIITIRHGLRLETLNIQNKTLICGISKASLVNFVNVAKNLKSLLVQSSCFSSDILKLVLPGTERQQLQNLSLLFTRADKFFKSISSDDWEKVSNLLPNLKVELIFDHTYPVQNTFKIMLPEVPVSCLKLCLQATVTEHVLLAADIYRDCLEILVITSTPSKELDEALVKLAEGCCNLKELHVWCRLSEDTVKKILSTRGLKKWTLAYKPKNVTSYVENVN